jgi:predicted ATPase with chaperone activity
VRCRFANEPGRPCGSYGDSTRECRCTPAIIQRYLSKISGPLLDRIDIHVEVPAVSYKELRGNPAAEDTSQPTVPDASRGWRQGRIAMERMDLRQLGVH